MSWGWDEAFGFYFHVLQKDPRKILARGRLRWLRGDIGHKKMSPRQVVFEAKLPSVLLFLLQKGLACDIAS
jgi:hypothetical protein